MKMKWLVSVCAAMLLSSMVCRFCSGDSIMIIDIHQSKKKSNMTEWKKNFRGPKGLSITQVQVFRKNAGGTYDNETDDWSASQTALPSSDLRLNLKNETAANIPYCTRLRLLVRFNMTDVSGDRGSTRIYAPDNQAAVSRSPVNSDTDKYIASIDSACFSGGPGGRNIPGIGLWVPANQFAYLYQVNHLGGDNAIMKFQLPNVPSLHGFTTLDYPHESTAVFDNITYYPTVPPEPPGGTSYPITDNVGLAMFTSFSYTTGIGTTSWGLQDNDAIAVFSGGGITEGYSSRLLAAFSPNGPQLPAGNWNAFTGFGSHMTGGSAFTPVPEPATVLLMGSALATFGWMQRRRFGRGR